ncbi:MAG TPA: LLM class flavin-dependent oxidoreductase [Solirubrobacteraceae bacterium]|nr:LLM class flavin-dependent oxidoreductase [Solirubrobacteraceae bacterium]
MSETGIFIVPSAEDPELTVSQALAADAAGLEYVAVQDHPYQRRFFDTWTFLSYVAGRTASVRLLTDVVNLPLRPPSVLAKSAASLDVLSGGRVEIGIGAGGFWDAVAAMGGPRRSPRESVDALQEAIAIIRDFWAGAEVIRREGEHYRVVGAKPGPPPAHRIGLWIGAYGPRMLRLTGRLGDAWLPSLGGHYLQPADVPPMHAAIDDAARAAGRDPSEIRRAINVMALEGDAGGWVDQLVTIATELRFETLLVGTPADCPVDFIRRLGEEIAPEVRSRTTG